jgi:hypothetical protein
MLAAVMGNKGRLEPPLGECAPGPETLEPAGVDLTMLRESMHGEVEAIIAVDSRARRAAPLDFVAEVLELLRDTEVEGFLKFWRSRVVSYPWYADDFLACVELVLAAPPADLRERLRERTGFVLNHVEPTRVTPYSNADVVAWLRDLTARMRAVYDEVLRTEEG